MHDTFIFRYTTTITVITLSTGPRGVTLSGSNITLAEIVGNKEDKYRIRKKKV